MLCGLPLMLQAAFGDGLAFDPFSLQQDCLAASEVDVGRGKIVDALVVAAVVIVGHKCLYLSFQIARQVVVLQQGMGAVPGGQQLPVSRGASYRWAGVTESTEMKSGLALRRRPQVGIPRSHNGRYVDGSKWRKARACPCKQTFRCGH
jgi:hypothetical protein